MTISNPRLNLEDKLLAALELVLSYEPGETPPMTIPRGLAIDRARKIIAEEFDRTMREGIPQ